MKTTIFLSAILASLAFTWFNSVQAQYRPPLSSNTELNAWANSLEQALEGMFGVDAVISAYNDGEHPNAYATTGWFGIPEVCLGRNFLEYYFFQKGALCIASVLAHEYAHLLQMSKEFEFQGKYGELHADFLAGYFMAQHFSKDISRCLPGIFFDFGDYWILDNAHHGTPVERMSAVMEGYRAGLMDQMQLEEAYELGLQVIQK